MTYEDYKKQFFEKRGHGFSSQPMTEKQFNEMMGIKSDDFHEPFLARKKQSIKKVKPTFEAYDVDVDCQLSFSILLEDELKELNFPATVKESLQKLFELAFKAGFKAGQLPENDLKFKRLFE